MGVLSREGWMVFSAYDTHMSQVFKDISYESQLSVSPGLSTPKISLIGHVGPNSQPQRATPAS